MEDKQIPAGWEENNFGALIIEKPKSHLKVSDAAGFGKFPFFTSGEAILVHNKQQIDGKNLFLATGGVANVKYYNGEVSYSTDTYALTSLDTDLKYLYYFLLNNLYYVNSNYFLGSGLKHLQKKDLKNHAFLLPKSTIEQKKIAEILCKIDTAIEQTQNLIAKYLRIKKGLMQDLLTKGIDENGNIRNKETHEFKDSELGRIPKEWECLELEKCCSKIQDGTHFSPKTDKNGKYKYLTSKNIRFGYLDLNNIEYLNEDAHSLIYKSCPVKLGDVLLTKDGANTGNICINTLKEEFSLLSSVAMIRGKEHLLINDYIVQFFMEEKGQKSLVDQMSGNAITRITLTKINKTLISFPEETEQKKIIEILKQKDSLTLDEKAKLKKLNNLKTALMQDLLSGKKRVTNLIKENAL